MDESPHNANGTKRRRVLILDDHPLMREGIAAWVNRQPDLVVCGEASSSREAVALVEKTDPDIVIADVFLPGRNGFEFLRDVLAIRPAQKVLMLSMHDESVYAERALRSGAMGYVMKEAGGEQILAGVRRVLDGSYHVSDQVAHQVFQSLAVRKPAVTHSPIGQLSDREFEIFELIGRGHDRHQIAALLRLSEKTVDVHRSRIKRKLGIRKASDLSHQAICWYENEHGAHADQLTPPG